jgi:hypothetical protein
LIGGGSLAFVLVLAVASVIVRALAPGPAAPTCPAGEPCGAPPRTLALEHEVTWSSPSLGFAFDYDPDLWQVTDSTDRSVVLAASAGGNPFELLVEAARASEASPPALLDATVRSLQDTVFAMAPSGDVLGAGIGYVGGMGSFYVGQVDTPQGPGGSVVVAVMAATDGRITAAVSVVADVGDRADAYAAADSILNTFSWTATAP